MVRLCNKRFLFLILIIYQGSLLGISSLANNDPYPMYTSTFDDHMVIWTKEYLKGCRSENCCFETFSFSISPFYQTARRGRTFAKESVYLGDLGGPWNILGMLYGAMPGNNSDITGTPTAPLSDYCTNLDASTAAAFNNSHFGASKIHIFADFFQDQTSLDSRVAFSESNPDTSAYLFTSTAVGTLQTPIKYRKVGVRGEFNWHVCDGIGLTLQSGVAEIRQTMTHFLNFTVQSLACPCPNNVCDNFGGGVFPGGDVNQPFDNNPCRLIPIYNSGLDPQFSTCSSSSVNNLNCTTPYIQIANELMESRETRILLEEIGLNPCNFEKTSFEDIRLIAWWRGIYEINRTRDHCCWPWFFITPSASFNVIIPTANKKNRRWLLSAPFGNDGHFSVGFDTGLSIDFVETVEIAFDCGLNYFFARDKNCYRLPTDSLQSGIFPFATKVKVQPGLNFNCSATLSAYHFLSMLSAYAQWAMVKHEKDKITLKTPDPVWTDSLIDKAECLTQFNSHFINAALNYDISPNITLGVLAQFPIAQRNAYKSTTWMATFAATF